MFVRACPSARDGDGTDKPRTTDGDGVVQNTKRRVGLQTRQRGGVPPPTNRTDLGPFQHNTGVELGTERIWLFVV